MTGKMSKIILSVKSTLDIISFIQTVYTFINIYTFVLYNKSNFRKNINKLKLGSIFKI